jgi:DNA-binding MarR family transcriptional regulator
MAAVRTPARSAAPDPPAARTFRELVRTFGLVERVMQTHFARFGISGAQWGVLRHLQRAESAGRSGLRMTDLSERLLIRPPSVTGVVDRLERAGLVGRTGSPSDQRSKLVALTSSGRRLVQRMLSVHERQIETVLGGLKPKEQTALHRYLARLGQHLEHLLANGPAMNSD